MDRIKRLDEKLSIEYKGCIHVYNYVTIEVHLSAVDIVNVYLTIMNPTDYKDVIVMNVEYQHANIIHQ